MGNFKSYDELPLTLNADDLSKFLGISKGTCYAMLKRKDFPTIRIGKRQLVSRDKFLEWIDKNSQEVV